MRFLTLIQVLELHRRVIEQSGGAFGIRDVGLLESRKLTPLWMNKSVWCWQSHRVS